MTLRFETSARATLASAQASLRGILCRYIVTQPFSDWSLSVPPASGGMTKKNHHDHGHHGHSSHRLGHHEQSLSAEGPAKLHFGVKGTIHYHHLRREVKQVAEDNQKVLDMTTQISNISENLPSEDQVYADFMKVKAQLEELKVSIKNDPGITDFQKHTKKELAEIKKQQTYDKGVLERENYKLQTLITRAKSTSSEMQGRVDKLMARHTQFFEKHDTMMESLDNMNATVDENPDRFGRGVADGDIEGGAVSSGRGARKRQTYLDLLNVAQGMDLSDIEQLGCVVNCGFDREDRAVIAIIAERLPHESDTLKRIFYYVIQAFDKVVDNPWTLLYINSKGCIPRSKWLADCKAKLAPKWERNLQGFVVYNPNMGLRIYFSSLKVAHKVTGGAEDKRQAAPPPEYYNSVLQLFFNFKIPDLVDVLPQEAYKKESKKYKMKRILVFVDEIIPLYDLVIDRLSKRDSLLQWADESVGEQSPFTFSQYAEPYQQHKAEWEASGGQPCGLVYGYQVAQLMLLTHILAAQDEALQALIDESQKKEGDAQLREIHSVRMAMRQMLRTANLAAVATVEPTVFGEADDLLVELGVWKERAMPDNLAKASELAESGDVDDEAARRIQAYARGHVARSESRKKLALKQAQTGKLGAKDKLKAAKKDHQIAHVERKGKHLGKDAKLSKIKNDPDYAATMIQKSWRGKKTRETMHTDGEKDMKKKKKPLIKKGRN